MKGWKSIGTVGRVLRKNKGRAAVPSAPILDCDQVSVFDRHPGFLEAPFGGRDGRGQHDDGLIAGRRGRDDAGAGVALLTGKRKP